MGNKRQTLKSYIYPIITLLISIISIIWMGKASLSTGLFAGLGEAVITLFILIPLMAITGSIYMGYKNFPKINTAIYSLLIALTYAAARFVEYNIEKIVVTGEYDLWVVHPIQIIIIAAIIYLISYLGKLVKYTVIRVKTKSNKEGKQ